jgi:hypothetical protein
MDTISSLSRCDHIICILFVSRRVNVAMSWNVRGSNSDVGENFRIRPVRSFDPHSLLYSALCVIPGVKSDRLMALTTNPRIAPMFKKCMLYVYSNSGASLSVLNKLRVFTKLITFTNVVMWEYFILIPILLNQFFWNLKFLDIFCKNIHVSSAIKFLSLEAEDFRADRRTDKYDEANSRY